MAGASEKYVVLIVFWPLFVVLSFRDFAIVF